MAESRASTHDEGRDPRHDGGVGGGVGGAGGGGGGGGGGWGAWGGRRGAWPVAVLALAGVLFVGGLFTAFKNRPTPDGGVVVEDARRQVSAGDFEEAIETINTRGLVFIERGLLNDWQQAELFALRAEAIYAGQLRLGIQRDVNDRNVLSDLDKAETLFASAREAGEGPGPGEADAVDGVAARERRQAWRVRSLLNLGEVERAADALSKLPATSERRQRLTRDVIDAALASTGNGAIRSVPGSVAGAGAGDVAGRRARLALELLEGYTRDFGLSESDRAWSVARRAELELARGTPNAAINLILREIQRLDAVDRVDEARLHLLLGRAYERLGDVREAVRRYERVERLADDGSTDRVAALISAGELLKLSASTLDLADEKFRAAATSSADGPALAPALLGLAEVAAARAAAGSATEAGASEGAQAESLRAYTELVRLFPLRQPWAGLDAGRVVRSLLDRHAERSSAGMHADALAFAELARALETRMVSASGGLVTTPSPSLSAGEPFADSDRRLRGELMERIAITHRRLADVMRDRMADPSMRGEVSSLELQRHLVSSAVEFEKLASFRLDDGDVGEYAEALWMAGDSYDLAGDNGSARRVFEQYSVQMPVTDHRQAEATFRLAQLLEASREYGQAASLYSRLIDARRGADSDKNVGLWAERSRVPLARCYLADGDETTDELASRILEEVLSGTVVRADAPEYREALIALADMSYQAGRAARAAELFNEAVARYAEQWPGEALVWRFKLADSYRLLAQELGDEALSGEIPQSERDRLNERRESMLRLAEQGFESFRAALAGSSGGLRDVVGRAGGMMSHAFEGPGIDAAALYERNAWFYIADCAFDLGEFDRAISLYEAARERYAEDPASLVALVQIVNAYVRQGAWAEAGTAQQRARNHFERLSAMFPERVWDSPQFPMQKRHWERWLDSRMLIEQRAQLTGVDAGGGG